MLLRAFATLRLRATRRLMAGAELAQRASGQVVEGNEDFEYNLVAFALARFRAQRALVRARLAGCPDGLQEPLEAFFPELASQPLEARGDGVAVGL